MRILLLVVILVLGGCQAVEQPMPVEGLLVRVQVTPETPGARQLTKAPDRSMAAFLKAGEDEGQPIFVLAQGTVTVVDPDDREVASSKLDQWGQAQFLELPPGDYDVRCLSEHGLLLRAGVQTAAGRLNYLVVDPESEANAKREAGVLGANQDQ